MEKIEIICGLRDVGGKKFLWALSLLDMRVYFREADINIDVLASELDDFIGFPPKGYEWEFKTVDDNKRVTAWISRTQTLINKQKENEDE